MIYNLPQGFYLRSTATWNFDLQLGTIFTFRWGLVQAKYGSWKTGRRLNLFAEPQVTIAHDGVAPKFQIFLGLNMQFPIGH